MTRLTDAQGQDDATKIVYVVSKQTEFIVVETVRHVWHCPCTWDGYVGEENVGFALRSFARHDCETPAVRVDQPPSGNKAKLACNTGENSGITDTNTNNNEICTTTCNQPVESHVGETEDEGDFAETDPRETAALASKIILTRRSKLSSKRRRRRARKAQKKLQGKLDEQFLDALRLEADDHSDAFLASQGLSNGNPVRKYLRLLMKVHYWARKQGIEPVEALEDIESWRVRSLDPHPATLEVKELLELANSPSPFEKAWKHLAPQILKRNDCDQETAEDEASSVIAELYTFMFTVWDDGIGCVSRSDDSDGSSEYWSEQNINST